MLPIPQDQHPKIDLIDRQSKIGIDAPNEDAACSGCWGSGCVACPQIAALQTGRLEPAPGSEREKYF